MSMLSRLGVVFARQWIAGTSIADVIERSKEINGNREKVLVNYLGEDITDRRAIGLEMEKYRELIDAMHRNRIRGAISVKPTQLGLALSGELFENELDSLADYASKKRMFIWLDMEGYDTVGKTINGYLKVFGRRRNIGICIQAKLRRSYGDIKMLVGKGAAIRLVKGAYRYSGEVAYRDGARIDANYMRCAEYLFRKSGNFMIATHDDRIIERCRGFEKRKRRRMSFAMLNGIRGKLAKELAQAGEEVYIYLPFGDDWFWYSVRRLGEEGHALLLLRSVFQG
ncbi:MAG: proline dehydrogenase family protein [Candidatus Micrarchaeota archaeon]|nr:proline dehydrogenase family protein [Candidatus Micrarchaeota archaeon]